MSFGAPIWFWAFAAFPLLIALCFANERRSQQLLTKVVAARLAPRLAGTVSVSKRRFRFLLLLLGLAATIVALAQPRYGVTWEETKRKGRDVLIAIDTSRSMLANDLVPNRLTRAKLAAQDLISELSGDRVGVIAFAGSSFLQAPLTVDYSAVLAVIQELDTNIIPQGGTNLASMINTARDAFGKGESDHRALIVFTDGEELDTDGIKAAEALRGEVRIFTVGLGSEEGALIPLSSRGGGTEFVKDERGQIVRSKLDEERLRKIAESTEGFYLRLQSGRPEMQQIIAEGLGKMSEQDIDARVSRRPIERYEWPLSAAMVLLASSMLLGERRRAVAAPRVAALLIALLMMGGSANAAKNPGVEIYRNAEAKLQAKDAAAKAEFERAYREFSEQLRREPDSPEKSFNLGAAAYKLNKFDDALNLFGKSLLSNKEQVRVDGFANLGNTLYKRGEALDEKEKKRQEWLGAVSKYDEALKLQPENERVKELREFVLRKLKELDQEPPKEDDQKQDQQDEQKDQKQDQQQQQDQQQNKDQQKGDQKQDQPQSGQDKEQQEQQSGGKDQQEQKKPEDSKEGEQPQPKDEQGKEEGKEEPTDGKEGQDQQPPKDGKDGNDQQPPKDQKGADGKSGDQQKDGPDGEQPQPARDQPQEKKEGELQPANPSGEQKDDPAAQEAAEAAAAAEGKMTEQQAKALLESLQSEDQKVNLTEPRERRARVLKDW